MVDAIAVLVRRINREVQYRRQLSRESTGCAARSSEDLSRGGEAGIDRNAAARRQSTTVQALARIWRCQHRTCGDVAPPEASATPH
jgi:hypothetical protein